MLRLSVTHAPRDLEIFRIGWRNSTPRFICWRGNRNNVYIIIRPVGLEPATITLRSDAVALHHDALFNYSRS